MFDFTPVARLYARLRLRRLDRMNAAAAQRRLLLRLIARAAGTRFGRDHDFTGIATVEDFQRRVPLRDYRAFWEEYWSAPFPVLRDCSWPGLIPFYAQTSGTTTGETKYIPYTRELGANAFRGMLDLFAHHLKARPQSRVFGGKGLMLSGDTDLEQLAPGVFFGAVSGISARRAPRWLQRRMLPPPEIARIKDWPDRIDRLAPLALGEDVRVVGGAPNWMLLFFDRLAALRPEEEARLANWFRDLDLVIHGGVNFTPYRDRFAALLEGARAETREAYSASEGFFAVADRGDGEGLRLLPDRGVFYEFTPVEELDAATPTRHWLGDVQTGVDYAMIVTTCAGAWAYILGDTVRFLSADPPRLLVTGRISYRLSTFGEHVIEEELAEAISRAARAIGTDVADYSVSPVMGDADRPSGRHHYIVECARPVTNEEGARFADRLDTALRELNADYREQRQKDFGLKPPLVEFAPPGVFAAWMKRRNRLGGQNKVPRIVHDGALFEDLKSFVETQRGKR
jgi:hypothetical protein